jgi:hypothetical protein
MSSAFQGKFRTATSTSAGGAGQLSLVNQQVTESLMEQYWPSAWFFVRDGAGGHAHALADPLHLVA